MMRCAISYRILLDEDSDSEFQPPPCRLQQREAGAASRIGSLTAGLLRLVPVHTAVAGHSVADISGSALNVFGWIISLVVITTSRPTRIIRCTVVAN